MATNTTKYLLKKPAYSDTADIGDINDNMDSIDSVLFNHAGSIAVICMGNVCAVSVSTGQYVLLQKSTIAGRTDGLYTAAKAIPANTVIDSSYLTAVSGGIANALNGKFTPSWISLNPTYGVEYCKMGKLVAVKVFKYSPGISSGTVIATLPSGYRPSARARFPGYNSEHEYDIGTDGTITVNGNAPNLIANIVFMM